MTLQRVSILLVLAWLVSTSQAVLAHGLSMTTAEVIQRHNNHITITIHTSLAQLFSRMEYVQKPKSLVHLANGSDQQVELFRQALLETFKQTMTVSVEHQALQSMQVRTLPSKELRHLLQNAVAEHVLKLAPKEGNHHHDEREHYLRIDVDGFMVQGKGQRVLEAQFPQELGQILVSFVQPKMQTIKPNEKGSHYVQAL